MAVFKVTNYNVIGHSDGGGATAVACAAYLLLL